MANGQNTMLGPEFKTDHGIRVVGQFEIEKRSNAEGVR
jgi:hypothetical protein